MNQWSLKKKIYVLSLFLVVGGVSLIGGYLFATQQSLQVQAEAKQAADKNRAFQVLSLSYEQAGVAVLKYIADPNQSVWDEKADANKNSEMILEELTLLAQDSATTEIIDAIKKIHKDTLIPVDAKIQEMILTSARDTVFEYYRQEYTPIYENLRKNLKAGRDKAEEARVEAFARQEKNFKRNALIVTAALVLGIFALLLALVQGVRGLTKTLGFVTKNLTVTSAETAAISRELSSASQSLSEGVNEGAAAFEETVASLEELSSMVKMNADNSKSAAELSKTSCVSAENGESEISKLILSINDLAKSSREIEDITSVIDDIAFQTNLLALNASVEAARAGEHGKGFAVVADAVRTLAQRSASAAKDISKLIQVSVEKTERGVVAANQSGTVLKDIVASVRQVAVLNSEIASASSDQAKGLGQINAAMNQLDAITQANATSATQSASSSDSMSLQAEALGEMVGALTQIIDGKTKVKTQVEGFNANDAATATTEAHGSKTAA